MTNQPTPKSAIVTGGANGIGRAVVEAFARAGVAVTFGDLEPEGARLEAEWKAQGLAVQFVQGDFAADSFCEEVARAAFDRWGRIDYLVNNAFPFLSKGLDASREDWLRSMEAGPIAFATMARSVVPRMILGGGGSIVNISSISAHIAQPNRWTYNAAKGAVNLLTRCMALDLARHNIRVNTVSPGWIWTREVARAANFDRAKWEPVWGRFHMLRRLGAPEEVTQAVLFLCGDGASFITAAELPVDGGYLGLGPEGLGDASAFAGSE
jgi:NAD(P)-dependent dehydrogenase (short-subunit alcohol dehydrogenase family)